MLSGKRLSFLSSISARLTLWSALVFSICIFLILVIFYSFAKNYILKSADALLDLELGESVNLYKAKGYDPLAAHIIVEAEEIGPQKVLYRIVNNKGQILATTDLTSWQPVPIKQEDIAVLLKSDRAEIVDLPDGESVRVVSRPLSDNLFIQGILRLKNEMELLQMYRLLLPAVGLVIVLIAATTSYLVVHGAMTRVEDMAKRAKSISGTDLSARLPVGGYNDELSHLSETFNQMLERIERLVIGMRNVTDDIAHDLKIPITRMKSRAELSLTNVTPSEDQISIAANTLEECERLLNLLNSMLEISEAEANPGNLKKESIDLNELLTIAVELFLPLAEQNQVALSFNSCGKVYIEGDLSKLQRALSNLIDNSIKYSGAGGEVIITLECKNSEVLVIIKDSGIGMSEDELSLVYERFYRADRSRSGSGSGLGLAMSKALIQSHGGSIDIQSRKGFGTTVVVKFILSGIR